jgi:hypothetical protein
MSNVHSSADASVNASKVMKPAIHFVVIITLLGSFDNFVYQYEPEKRTKKIWRFLSSHHEVSII